MTSSHGSASMAPTPLSSVRREMVRSGRKCISVRFGFEVSERIAFHDLRDQRGEAIVIRLSAFYDALNGGNIVIIHRAAESVGEKVLGQAAHKLVSLRPSQHVLESNWTVKG